ncbi:unnamed protein product [Ambrosiozyma monospora]|uniref:Unnamed protein product n=1 Tax=Ambrosiozyma monospora TaxID=43982 RepID=A0ACB5UAB0_AMBMO|nr:unnamed protein product [Ambrosiozyma monospora]
MSNPYAASTNPYDPNMSFRGSQFPANNYPQPIPVPASTHHAPGYTPRGRRMSALDSINNLIPSDNPNVKKFEQVTQKVEDIIDQYLGGAKPYVPSIGRTFIVATFIEDAIRIVTQWKEQVYYLSTYRNVYPWFVKGFLIFNVIAMFSGSALVSCTDYSLMLFSY